MKLVPLLGKTSKNFKDSRWNSGMTLRPRVVSVKQLPEKMDLKRGRLFFRELESCMNTERPAIVVDCSKVREMDNNTLHLLLCCLEGALKRNGDVRLAAVAPHALLSLEAAGTEQVFNVFETVELAVESFQRGTTHTKALVAA